MRLREILTWSVIALGLSVFALNLWPLLDASYWWHVSLGRMTEAAQAIPTFNYFTYTTSSDTPVTVLSWLSRWWLFAIEATLGTHGSLALRGILAGMTAALMWGALGLRNPWLGVAVACVASALVVGSGLGPATFGAVLVAAALWITARMADGRRTVKWALVCAITVPLWVGVDTSFWVMPAMLFVAAAALEEGRRWLALGALVATGLTFASPLGAGVWVSLGPVEWPETLVVVGLLLTSISLWMARREVTRSDLGLFAIAVVGVGMNLGAVSLLIAAVSTRHALNMLTRELEPVACGNRHIAAAVVALGLAVATSPLFAHTEWVRIKLWDVREQAPLRGLVDRELPVESVELVASWSQPERVFHSPEYAGLLMWRLTKGRAASLLFDAPLPALKSEAVQALRETLTQGDLWRGVFQQYDVKVALLALPADRELAERLAKHPDWHVIRETSDNALIVHSSSAGAP